MLLSATPLCQKSKESLFSLLLYFHTCHRGTKIPYSHAKDFVPSPPVRSCKREHQGASSVPIHTSFTVFAKYTRLLRTPYYIIINSNCCLKFYCLKMEALLCLDPYRENNHSFKAGAGRRYWAGSW